MSRQSDREEFISIMAQEGVPLSVARGFLRAGATLHRLAELECSSEAANNDRVRCPKEFWRADGCLCADYGDFDYTNTGNLWTTDPARHGKVARINVKAARVEAHVAKLAAKHGLGVITGGDPRGAVLLVTVPSGRTNDWGKRGIVAG